MAQRMIIDYGASPLPLQWLLQSITSQSIFTQMTVTTCALCLVRGIINIDKTQVRKFRLYKVKSLLPFRLLVNWGERELGGGVDR